MDGTVYQDKIRKVSIRYSRCLRRRRGRLVITLAERPDAVHIGTDVDEWWTSKLLLDTLAVEPKSELTSVRSPRISTFASMTTSAASRDAVALIMRT